MDDALLVGGFEGFGNLARNRQGVGRWQAGAGLQPLGERLPLDDFEHQCVNPVCLLEAMNRCDVGMVQRRQQPGFPLEARQPFGIAREE